MNKIINLVDMGFCTLWRGNILRLPAKWPYEDVVDFMIYESQDEERPYGLIVTSGQKAGLILTLLPVESVAADSGGLSVRWVVDNWGGWIYPECDVSDVYLVDGYKADWPVVGGISNGRKSGEKGKRGR
jgi:hypothetical protein